MATAHDLVVLLEGVNDIAALRTPAQVAAALRSMIQAARAAGKSVLLSGLWPVKPMEEDTDEPRYKAATPAEIATYNAAIAQMAAEEAVPRIDMVAAFGPSFIALLSPDGLHPNESGYQRMAEIVRDAIVANFALP